MRAVFLLLPLGGADFVDMVSATATDLLLEHSWTDPNGPRFKQQGCLDLCDAVQIRKLKAIRKARALQLQPLITGCVRAGSFK
ncbi:membrane-associated PAP2 superfamily phosphatase [Rhizobium sp. BK619]|nr:membrane-associated PAP2 superfamily phosphatase [Rhizobium sp. BK619]